MSQQPNIIERMDELIAALDRAGSVLEDDDYERKCLAELSFAEGIAGEILTMIDGR